MTTKAEFYENIRKGLGARPSIPARQAVATAEQNGQTEIHIKYEWIANAAFYEWLQSANGVDFFDGETSILVFLEETNAN